MASPSHLHPAGLPATGRGEGGAALTEDPPAAPLPTSQLIKRAPTEQQAPSASDPASASELRRMLGAAVEALGERQAAAAAEHTALLRQILAQQAAAAATAAQQAAATAAEQAALLRELLAAQKAAARAERLQRALLVLTTATSKHALPPHSRHAHAKAALKGALEGTSHVTDRLPAERLADVVKILHGLTGMRPVVEALERDGRVSFFKQYKISFP
ncbi:hypothetical protein HYH03_002810 [Edaphochlamys debaryana]|uniref:Uncharacterized protein n=1 Tax=Edaphochlamys debaryana TaxID=47281 RepID=A0A835YAV2_9CHLO|nr:hypothetical protein HYH03_002810 [Edaphochlamys debaryana]|eukprot:KAG2499231.1 hypothetical protein HYH03_002810 [Edaphochlamys debaryana]